MKLVENLWNAAPSTQNRTEDGVFPFSVQEYTRILCRLFVTWRCRPPGSADSDDENSTRGQSPLVWMTWRSRMRRDPGMTVRVELPNSGSPPLEEDAPDSVSKEDLLSLLDNDNFSNVVWSQGGMAGSNCLKTTVAKLSLMYLMDNWNSGMFPKTACAKFVIEYELFDGFLFHELWDTKAKAKDFVLNKLTSVKLDGKNIASGNTMQVMGRFWRRVVNNADQCFAWLKKLSGPKPAAFLLYDGYNPSRTVVLEEALQSSDHSAVVRESSLNCTLSPNLFRYMKILRMEWEGNRLNAARALHAGRQLSYVQASANHQMAQRLGVSCCLDSAMIRRQDQSSKRKSNKIK